MSCTLALLCLQLGEVLYTNCVSDRIKLERVELAANLCISNWYVIKMYIPVIYRILFVLITYSFKCVHGQYNTSNIGLNIGFALFFPKTFSLEKVLTESVKTLKSLELVEYL